MIRRFLPVAALALVACGPRSVAEAETKGNVDWLERNGSPEAILALGRMADTNERALGILKSHAPYDTEVYLAAWQAVARDAPWGAPLLKEALADPTRAELAAARMDAKDAAHLAPFAKELEDALVRLSATPNNGAIATDLAAIGAPARAAVERRLADATTRGGMCRGIGAEESSADARAALMSVSAGSRDHALCIEAALARSGDKVIFAWLAKAAEPGFVSAASANKAFACEKVAELWSRAIAARPAEAHAGLVVPLGTAIRRCTAAIDPVLAQALAKAPPSRALIVKAVDPFDPYGKDLKQTCAALPGIAQGGDAPAVKERARDALEHGCKR